MMLPGPRTNNEAIRVSTIYELRSGKTVIASVNWICDYLNTSKNFVIELPNRWFQISFSVRA